jgi:N-acetylmuramoyl-L-alanine amidase
MIVLHYTGMKTGEAALARLRDVGAKVSAHYMVEQNGDVLRLVAEESRAWHAGVGSWKGDTDINARSIGIEIVNPGHEFGYQDFPADQIDAIIALIKDIRTRHNILQTMVLGHADVAPRRKEDPGEKFPWKRLAAEGVAIGPFDGDGDDSIPYEKALSALQQIGYDAPSGDHVSGLTAFQRRFCPASLGQGFDARTKAALLATLRATTQS